MEIFTVFHLNIDNSVITATHTDVDKDEVRTTPFEKHKAKPLHLHTPEQHLIHALAFKLFQHFHTHTCTSIMLKQTNTPSSNAHTLRETSPQLTYLSSSFSPEQ
ncbi:hypothetical protein E2C01_086584 [Portunus trituberculatus]|uniref:Uncharacterized protein n=1 Tax=Portunus trituberculatus TaxID=210409 RepID=A0A5B7J9P4_PORTR|nr:hypothetical protein [Portunus trituberculatus]